MADQRTPAPDDQAPEETLDNTPEEVNDDDFETHFNEFSSASPGEDREEGSEGADNADESEEGDDQAGGKDEGGQEAELTPREKELQSQLDRLRQSEASQRGRVGALQRRINELSRQQPPADQGQQPEGQQPTQSNSEKAQQEADQKQAIAEEHGSDDWKAFEEDFPEIANVLNARFEKLSRLEERVNQRIASVEQSVQPIQQQAHEQYLDGQMRALEARHSDWREVVNAPAFHQWLQQQPQWMQEQMASENADDASALLDIYKRMHTAGSDGASGDADKADAQRARRQQRLAGAMTPQRRGAARRDAVPEDWEGQFNHFARKR